MRSPDGSEESPREPPVEVPPEELSTEALRGVVQSFVLREGTDYGEREVSLEVKVEQVLRQLARREAIILFDPASSSIDIVPVRHRP